MLSLINCFMRPSDRSRDIQIWNRLINNEKTYKKIYLYSNDLYDLINEKAFRDCGSGFVMMK